MLFHRLGPRDRPTALLLTALVGLAVFVCVCMACGGGGGGGLAGGGLTVFEIGPPSDFVS